MLNMNRVPINTQAAIVMSKGTQPPKSKGIDHVYLHTCKYIPENIQDLTGVRFGRLTVIGLHAHTQDKVRWVVKCDCGNYNLRKTKAIRNKNNSEDRCYDCRNKRYLRNQIRKVSNGEVL